jgi:hypothetical protein
LGGAVRSSRDATTTTTSMIAPPNLIAPPCTQTWPGRLSKPAPNVYAVGDEDKDDAAGRGRRRRVNVAIVACLNPAAAWCDGPDCNVVRCGPQGCLLSYQLGGGRSTTAGGDRDDPPLQFIWCLLCSVLFCNKHGGKAGAPNGYFEQRQWGRHCGGRGEGGKSATSVA